MSPSDNRDNDDQNFTQSHTGNEVEKIHFNVPKISTRRLARELGANPTDFTQTRKDFKAWFLKTMRFTHSVNPETKRKEISNINLVPNPEAIYDVPDGANLFLYLDGIPEGVDWEQFSVFLSLYQPVFKMLALEERAKIFAESGPDQQEKFADWESRSILLEIMRLKDARVINFSGSISSRMARLPQHLKEPEDIRKDIHVWSKRRPGIGMLFTNNIATKEHPELDLPYLDELLCYHDSMLFQTLISVSRKIPEIWGLWVAAHHEILADTTSETHKLFCAIFHIPEGKLFEEDGSIRQEAWITISADIYESLVMVERKKQESVELELGREANRQRLLGILSNPLQITCSDNFILTCDSIPPELKSITVDIKRNDKTVARTSFHPGEMPVLDLKTCTFETFPPNSQKPTSSWETVSQWRGGDSYTIMIEGRIDSQKGKPQVIHSWKQEKTQKSSTITNHVVIPTVREKVAKVVPIIPNESIAQSSPPPAKTSKAPKESEMAELQAALELFLDKSDDELQSFFLDHHVWDEDKQTLTLAIPIEELEEMGYTPQELSEVEYGPILQWAAKLEEKRWIMTEGTPDKIREIIPAIYGHLARQAQAQKDRIRVEEIDTELGEIGLQPSRRSSEILRKEVANIHKREPINTTRLEAKILELGIRERGFRCYCNATSITLAKMSRILGESTINEWSIVYNWQTDTFEAKGLEKDTIFRKRIENALLRFLVCIDEDMIEEILIGKMKQNEGDKLENGLKERLEKGKASLYIKFHGQDIMIPDVSGKNYPDKIAEIREQYGPDISIFIVYRTFSYGLYDGEFRAGQDRTYDQCIEKHLDVIQARCRATLAQKASFRESTTSGSVTSQERDAFTNGVADYCRAFFFKKDPSSERDMEEFLEFIHREGTPAEKRQILYDGVRHALFGDAENTDISPNVCREFFFKKDPNNLDDVADFLASLQEKGTNQDERPGEKHVGIVYNSPVIGPVSDIPRILAKETTKKKGKKMPED